MKRLIAVLLIITVLHTVVFASTAEVVRESGVIVVAGNTEPETKVTLLMLKDGKTNSDIQNINALTFSEYVEYIDQTVSLSDGSFRFNFGVNEKVSFQRLCVFIKEITEDSQVEELNVVYYTLESVNALAEEIIDCTTDDEVAVFIDVDTSLLLDLNTVFYKNLDDAKKMLVLDKVAALTAGDVQKIRDVFFENSLLQEINELADNDDMLNLIKVASDINMSKEILGFETGNKSRYASLKDYQSLFITNVLKKESFDSVKEFNDWCNVQLALTCVKCFKSTAIESVLKEFETYLGIDLSLISGKNAEDVYVQLAGNTYEDAESFKTAYTEAVNGSENKPNTNKPVVGGTGGGGGGGGGGSFGGAFGTTSATKPSTVVTQPETTVTETPKTPSFNDVEDEYYAYEAIEALVESGVLSGYPDGSFKPEAKVTRAEFIKMLSAALIKENGDKAVPQYVDVADDVWYKPYVELAVSNGIVNGISDKEIGATLDIKREELCTMVYRVCLLNGIKGADKTVEFADNEEISDFAADAVKFLAGLGVVNGYDGSFAPKDTATRGQCAKILYEVIKLSEVSE